MTERFVKVEFDYDPLKADELSLAVGEYLRIVKSTDPDWWVGQKASGEQGWFPSNFVVPAETSEATGFKPRPLSGPPKRELPEPAPSLPVPAPDRVTLARVEFDYDPQASDELELKQGEVITIISKDTGVNGWWRGDRNGKTGTFIL
ncbi:SH3 domain-containing protein [Paraphysoderma sedebokerense]|nr:SH3 domain-containing protein [Paraphysoderma sedebokerense]